MICKRHFYKTYSLRTFYNPSVIDKELGDQRDES